MAGLLALWVFASAPATDLQQLLASARACVEREGTDVGMVWGHAELEPLVTGEWRVTYHEVSSRRREVVLDASGATCQGTALRRARSLASPVHAEALLAKARACVGPGVVLERPTIRWELFGERALWLVSFPEVDPTPLMTRRVVEVDPVHGTCTHAVD